MFAAFTQQLLLVQQLGVTCNYFIAASVAAADQDLLPFFRQNLGWKISGGTPRYLKMRFNIPP
jgi:hypothetical protein